MESQKRGIAAPFPEFRNTMVWEVLGVVGAKVESKQQAPNFFIIFLEPSRKGEAEMFGLEAFR